MMENREIKFSHNWNNKLDNPIFTTIRISNESKLKYYKGAIGCGFNVFLRKKKYCYAELQQVEEFLFDNIPEGLLMTDTGMQFSEMQQLFADFGIEYGDKVLILTFERIEKLKGVKE